MTDKDCYAGILADKFDYTNTHYDREPRLDFTEPHPGRAGAYDFILSADVLEHIAPPVERALDEIHDLLKPYGFLRRHRLLPPAATRMREHFPDLYEYRICPAGRPGRSDQPPRATAPWKSATIWCFTAAPARPWRCASSESPRFEARLRGAGFQDVHFLTSNLPEWGILFDHDISQPLVARKQPFALDRCAQTQLFEAWLARRRRHLENQLRLAAQSRWIKLGRKLGVGPNFETSRKP